MKGQMTFYLIFIVVILMIMALLIYGRSDVSEGPLVVTPQTAAIEQCIDTVLEEAILLVGFQGGYVYLPEGIMVLPNYYSDVPYWFDNELMIVDDQTIINEIGRYVEQYLPECVSEFPFVKESEEAVAIVRLDTEGVTADVTMPVVIEDGGAEVNLEKFSGQKKVRLIHVLDIARQIAGQISEDRTAIDVTLLGSFDTINNIYNYDDYNSIIAIKDLDSQIVGDNFVFLFAVKLEEE